MSTTISAPSIGIAGQSTPARIASIDIFRGLTMAVMIFVNELADVRGLPWWTYHAKANWDVMTYVDMVYPFFLFIVGLAIPLAIRARLKKNPSTPALWLYFVLRSVSLIVLGCPANADNVDAVRTHLKGDAWGLLGLLGGVLFWNVYGDSKRYATSVLRAAHHGPCSAGCDVCDLSSAYGGGNVRGWIDGSYPEILGLIGYTYLSRRCSVPSDAPLALGAARVVYRAGGSLRLLDAALAKIPEYAATLFLPVQQRVMGGMTMAGVVTSSIFLGAHRWHTARQNMLLAVAFAVPVLAAGWLLTPLGISKIRATPTWSLYSVGAAVLCFTLLYWICDVKKRTTWALFVQPPAQNALTYLLPDFYAFLISLTGAVYFETHFHIGWPGVVNPSCSLYSFWASPSADALPVADAVVTYGDALVVG